MKLFNIYKAFDRDRYRFTCFAFKHYGDKAYGVYIITKGGLEMDHMTEDEFDFREDDSSKKDAITATFKGVEYDH